MPDLRSLCANRPSHLPCPSILTAAGGSLPTSGLFFGPKSHVPQRPASHLRLFLLFFLLFGLTLSCSGSADRLDDYVRSQIRLRHIPGLSLAVVKNGRVVRAQGYGLANVEMNVPASSHTVYQLASLTKQFTATAIMLLVQDGKIAVDDPICSYVDGLPETWRAITLRHLLTHTSGLKDYLTEAEDAPGSSVKSHEETTPEKNVRSISGFPLDFAPGERYAYSNSNYLLLSMVVHRVSGLPYDQFLAERVFKPLQMTTTRLTSSQDLIPDRAAGYTWTGTQWRNSAALNPTLWDNGDGGILSTVLDLAKWDAALYQNTILTEASKRQMWTPLHLNDGQAGSYGFGWGIGEQKGHRLLWHTGGRPGTSTAIARYVDDRLTVIVLADQDNSRCIDIAHRIAGFYLPSLAPPVYRSLRDTEPSITAQIRSMLEGAAEGRPIAEVLPPAIPTGVNSFPDAVKSSRDLYDALHRLGSVRSIRLIERKQNGDTRRYRYEVIYQDARLLAGLEFDPGNRITRMDFQIE